MSTLTLVHVVLSLIGILAGFVVVYGLFKGNRMDRWTTVFLATTVLASLTGFFFPFHKLLPSHILGVLSLLALAVANPGPLRVSAGRWLAPHLRDYGRDRTLFQLFRFDCAALLESSGTEGPGSDTVGTPVPGRTNLPWCSSFSSEFIL